MTHHAKRAEFLTICGRCGKSPDQPNVPVDNDGIVGGLQDHQRTLLVGTRSVWNGSVRTAIQQPNGGLIDIITTTRYTSSDRSIQAFVLGGPELKTVSALPTAKDEPRAKYSTPTTNRRMPPMKIAVSVVLAFVTLAPLTSADAVVCTRGVYRAGCAGPHGAAVVRKPYGYNHGYYHGYNHRPPVACASGPYRAGCAGPNGAAVVRRPY